MKLYFKIILTIPVLIGLMYTLTFFSVDLYLWIINNIVSYNYLALCVGFISYPSLIYLIYRLWSFKNIKRDYRWKWTFLLILFSGVAMPIYIWKKDDELIKENELNTTA